MSKVEIPEDVASHPLFPHFVSAIRQAMYGKGERHGGAVTPFNEQPWRHYAEMHGRGFLTGQAAKKLEEAASTRSGEPFAEEVRGAMVYLGMAMIVEAEAAKDQGDAKTGDFRIIADPDRIKFANPVVSSPRQS